MFNFLEKQKKEEVKPYEFTKQERDSLLEEFQSKGLSSVYINQEIDGFSKYSNLYKGKTFEDFRERLNKFISWYRADSLNALKVLSDKALEELERLKGLKDEPSLSFEIDMILGRAGTSLLDSYISQLRNFPGSGYSYDSNSEHFFFVTEENKEKGRKIADLLEKELEKYLKEIETKSEVI